MWGWHLNCRRREVSLEGAEAIIAHLNDQHSCTLNRLDQFHSLFRAEDADGGGEAVGKGSARSHHRHAARAENTQPGPRVNNVRIAFPVNLDKLLGIAGSCNRSPTQDQVAYRLRPARPR